MFRLYAPPPGEAMPQSGAELWICVEKEEIYLSGYGTGKHAAKRDGIRPLFLGDLRARCRGTKMWML